MTDKLLGIVLCIIFVAVLAIVAPRYYETAGWAGSADTPPQLAYVADRLRFAYGAAAIIAGLGAVGALLVNRSNPWGWRVLTVVFGVGALLGVERIASWQGSSSDSTWRLVFAFLVLAVSSWVRGRRAERLRIDA